MSSCYPHLFSPIEIKGKTFKNRIMVSPMGLGEPAPPGVMTKEGVEYYRTVAKGGAGRICTGENDVVYGSAVFGKYQMFVDELAPELLHRMQDYAQACHENGALAFTSFNHMGVYARTKEKMANAGYSLPPAYHKDGTPYEYPDVAYGPSEMIIDEPYDGYTSRRLEQDNDNGKHVYEMDETMMNEIADAFAQCAKNAKLCGLDGIVLHSGHGFLFSQWVSRRFNKRTDKYGGSMENRARFPIMVLQRIREAVGDDFIVELRFSAEEDISPICKEQFLDGCVTIEETVEFFKVLDQYPGLLDIAHITGGLHTVPVYNTRVTANSFFPMGLNVEGAAAVKAAVKNIKVGVVGSMSDPDLCEQVIAEGKADFVILCRQLILSDPEFPKKAEAGHPEQIDNCLRCALCRANQHCAVNPSDYILGEADPLYLREAAAPKKIAIVGGGIGGMKAAEYAAQTGNRVVLFEKTDALGGILKYTDADDFKQDIRRFKMNMILRLQAMPNVEIRYHTEATPEELKAEGFDAVIAAVGGKTTALPISIAEGVAVPDAVEAYLNGAKVGERVAVIGAGLTGVEAAIHWQSKGNKVTLISRSPELMRNFIPHGPADGSPDAHLIWLHELAVDVRKGCACEAITEKGVWVKNGEERLFIPADTVINATGVTADPEYAESFRSAAPAFYAIGDAVKVGLIGDAVLAAREAVVAINQIS